MAYVGPCYLCGVTLGEYETRIYVQGRGKAHPACQSTIAGTDVIVNVDDSAWGDSFPAGTSEVSNGLSIQYARSNSNITVDPVIPVDEPVTRRIRIRKGQSAGKTEFTGDYEVLGDVELLPDEAVETERPVMYSDPVSGDVGTPLGTDIPFGTPSKPVRKSSKKTGETVPTPATTFSPKRDTTGSRFTGVPVPKPVKQSRGRKPAGYVNGNKPE